MNTLLAVLLFSSLHLISNVSCACSTNLPKCRTSGTRLYCYPIAPIVPHFVGTFTQDCVTFQLYGQWTLETLPSLTFSNFKGIKQMYLENAGIRYLTCGTFDAMIGTLENIRLYNNLLTEIEQCTFRNLTSVTHLQISNNKLQMIVKEAFWSLSNLQTLDLSSNLLSTLHKDLFSELSNLNRLYLQRNYISDLQEGIFDINESSLYSIDLSDNDLSDLPRDIFSKLKKLEHLNIRNNKLTSTVWESLRPLVSLKTLFLDRNRIESTGISVLNTFDKLEILDVSHNLIETVNGVYLRSGVLRSVSFASNKIEQIPNDFFSSTQTFPTTTSVYIHFDDNFVENLHMNLPDCVYSCSLYLQNNRLNGLTFSHIKGDKLNELNVENNNLVTLSDSLPHASVYRLSNNPLSTITAMEFLKAKLNYTQYLYMSNVSMFCSDQDTLLPIPQSVNVSTVEIMDLRKNCISEDFLCALIPAGVRSLSLNLDQNKFVAIPEDCIRNISEVRSLLVSLKYNAISNFDYEYDYGQLTDINLEGNYIQSIPSDIELKGLNKVRLRKNQLSDIEYLSFGINWPYGRNRHNHVVIDLANNSIQNIREVYVNHTSYDGFWLTSEIDISSNLLSTMPIITDIYNAVLESYSVSISSFYRFTNNSLENVETINITLNEGVISINHLYVYMYFTGNAIENISKPLVSIESKALGSPYINLYVDVSFNSLSSYPLCENFVITKVLYSDNLIRNMRLSDINLSNNRIQTMPGQNNESACFLEAGILNLAENEIGDITTVIGENVTSNPNLMYYLILRENNIHFIADFAFSRLTSLNQLDLSSNKLSVLPKGIDQLKNLDRLDISNNRIVHFTYKLSQRMYFNLYMKDNPIHCSCSLAWMRNNSLTTDDALCASPLHNEGELVACFPIDTCNERFSINLYKARIDQCSGTENRDIYINVQTLYLGSKINVTWRTYKSQFGFRYRVIAKKMGVEVSRSDILHPKDTIYTIEESEADQVCVIALNDSFSEVYEKCIPLIREDETTTKKPLQNNTTKPDTFRKTDSSEILPVVIALSVIVALSILLNIILILMKFRTLSCCNPTGKNTHDSLTKHSFADNPAATNDRGESVLNRAKNIYEDARAESTELQIYDEIEKE